MKGERWQWAEMVGRHLMKLEGATGILALTFQRGFEQSGTVRFRFRRDHSARQKQAAQFGGPS